MVISKPDRLIEPEPCGFLYLGFQLGAAPKGPLYRYTPSRQQAAARLLKAASELDRRPAVLRTRVFRSHLVPPLAGAPRCDFVMLIRTSSLEDLAEVRSGAVVESLGGVELLSGRNAARIGDTEADAGATFLFNHFTVGGEADPVGVWQTLVDWYYTRIGVDNSTALQSVSDGSRFPFVNYVRIPSSPPVFLLNQILRPSFYRTVRGALKRNGMRALPGFYRMLR